MEECIRKDADRAVHEENLLNKVVFDCMDPSPYWQSSTNPTAVKIDVQIFPDLKPFYILTDESDNSLIFESRFESGNLRRAIKVYANYLVMNMNTISF